MHPKCILKWVEWFWDHNLIVYRPFHSPQNKWMQWEIKSNGPLNLHTKIPSTLSSGALLQSAEHQTEPACCFGWGTHMEPSASAAAGNGCTSSLGSSVHIDASSCSAKTAKVNIASVLGVVPSSTTPATSRVAASWTPRQQAKECGPLSACSWSSSILRRLIPQPFQRGHLLVVWCGIRCCCLLYHSFSISSRIHYYASWPSFVAPDGTSRVVV